MQETELYPPVKQFLEGQGYEVKGEVNHCDVVAVRGDELPVIVELKLSFNLSVLLQVVDRLSLSPFVYIAIPLDVAVLRKQRKRVIKLLRMLGLGLMMVDAEAGCIDVWLDPAEYKSRIVKSKQQRLLKEFAHRVGDPNPGGHAMRKGLLTAYRQRALKIARYLQQHGATKASVIASAVDEPGARAILYRDVYGWFDKVSRGIYALSPKGKKEIPQWLS